MSRRGSGAGKKGKKKSKKLEVTEEQLQEIREAFGVFNPDEDGYIRTSKLHNLLIALSLHLEPAELKELKGELDPDGEGRFGFDEFVVLISDRLNDRDVREEALKSFELFDRKGRGYITIADLRQASRELGQNMAEEELQGMMEIADANQDGRVTKDDFLRILERTHLV
ncbi:EF-hand [Basidiobolus meristosporus CBS 931.73]|uniref:EF-hand n=1 Tax=Basidiobolus meristosporus CBS 931.73 TaxID=1314790 RepID=A0A1Y1Z9A0_9FUNG|nr:EF-hand [Basidiobolus meristosporus CBS 931.73]|eukprot:ORY06831.1 EF-hand [Basidiobolus meristosporus CBS 931.73]